MWQNVKIDLFLLFNISYKGITTGTKVQLYHTLRILTQMRNQSGQVQILLKDIETQRAHRSLDDISNYIVSRVTNRYTYSGSRSARYSFISEPAATKNIMQ